jgi:alkanesulfonate monooxygenase SsuD/methylene tetrahydromethanopterin reductase-like flavin-dependent oxidoreductase (luciferase family)
MDRLTFGLSLPNRAVLFGLEPQKLFRIARIADESDYFDSVWVGDNFLSKPRLEAIVLLSGLATITRRVKLGTVCLATFPMRHPVQLAIQWASLDVLSGGRTILAVCLGQSAKDGVKFAAEYEALGIRNEERVGRLEEGIDLLRRLWAPNPVTFSGRFYSFNEVDAQPKPVQASIPIVIAANPWEAKDQATRERIMRRVARLSDGWQTDGIPAAEFAAVWSGIRGYAAEYGRSEDLSHASLHLMVNINQDEGRARREAVEFLDHYYGMGTVGEDKIGAWLAAGPPESVAERIDSYVEAGCTTVIVRFAGPDQERQLSQCIERVIPAFAGRIAVRS